MPMTDLTNTEWTFNDTLILEDLPITSARLDFITPEYWSSVWGTIYFYTDSMSWHMNDEVGEIQTVYEYSSWKFPKCKHISITGGTDATNSTVIAWLQANATQLGARTPKEEYIQQLTDLANAINEKTGGTSPMTVAQMAEAVRSIQTGGGNSKFAQLVERSITEVTAEDLASATYIAGYAFGFCKELVSVLIPSNVTSIGYASFNGCTRLSSINIPSSVTGIGALAFKGCTGLTSIIIPSSVKVIYEHAFVGCTNLTIYCQAASQPSGWISSWNPSNCPVVWGYTG